MAEIKLSRKELYDLVWSEPMTSIAKKYQISDVGLRKICIRMSVPLPRGGHWGKVKSGKQIYVGVLSENYSGDEFVTLKLREPGSEKQVSSKAKQNVLTKEIKSNLELPIKKATEPDPLIIKARKSSNENRKDYGGVVNLGWENLNINVSRKNIERALLFMDSLIKLLKERGISVIIKDSNTFVVFEKEEMRISLREKFERIPSTNSWETNTRPTDILVFHLKAGYVYNWELKDGKIPLEDQLPKIIAKIEVKGNERVEERIRHEKYRAEQKEIERIKNELKLRKEKELADFKGLLREANRWHQSNILRGYIESRGNEIINNRNEGWLEWAKAKADWFDPFIEATDDLLLDVNRNTLI